MRTKTVSCVAVGVGFWAILVILSLAFVYNIQAAEDQILQRIIPNGASELLERVRSGKKNVVMAAELLHREHPSSPFKSRKGATPDEVVAAMVRRTELRINGSFDLDTNELDNASQMKGLLFPQMIVHRDAMEYMVRMDVGTGPASATFTFLLDTGSSITWLLCKPGGGIAGGQHGQASAPIFDSARSPSFRPVPCPSPLCSSIRISKGCVNKECTYANNYADKTFTKGILAQEAFTFDRVLLPTILFGCAREASASFAPASGILGFGSHRYSLPSQTDQNVFFCMPQRAMSSDPTATTPGVVGLGNLELTLPSTITTRLIHSQKLGKQMVPLVGISIDGQLVQGLDASSFADPRAGNEESGIILDTGGIWSQLVDNAYTLVRDAFREAARAKGLTQVSLHNAPPWVETCYTLSPEGPTHSTIPSMELHFEGHVTLLLPPKNVLFPFKPSMNIYCLAIIPTPAGRSLLGNVQLSSFLVSIDTKKMTVSFTPEYC